MVEDIQMQRTHIPAHEGLGVQRGKLTRKETITCSWRTLVTDVASAVVEPLGPALGEVQKASLKNNVDGLSPEE